MKIKIIQIIILIGALTFVVNHASQAKEIGELSTNESISSSSVLVTDDTEKQEASLTTTSEIAEKNNTDSILISSPQASNRVERMYDSNRDGSLQEDEIIKFLNEVVLAVERKGSFFVSSEVLQKFDKDNDERINRNEVLDIKKKLEEYEENKKDK